MGQRVEITDADVLQAAGGACAQYTAYIGDELHRRLGAGRGVSSGRLLRRLRRLESQGLLKRSTWPNGYYGYFWHFTEAGRAALKGQHG